MDFKRLPKPVDILVFAHFFALDHSATDLPRIQGYKFTLACEPRNYCSGQHFYYMHYSRSHFLTGQTCQLFTSNLNQQPYYYGISFLTWAYKYLVENLHLAEKLLEGGFDSH